jgi:hypothetical protein
LAEFTKVAEATKSPTKCFLCHTHDGPFIDCHLEQVQIATGTGIMEYSGHAYICTHDPELGRSGCVEQLGYAAGTMVDHTRLGVKEAETEQLKRRIALLEADLVEQTDRKTVTLKQLRKVMAEQPVNAVATEPVPAAADFDGW